MSLSQSAALMPLRSKGWFPTIRRAALGASDTFLEATAPVKLSFWHGPRALSAALGPGRGGGGIPMAAPPVPEHGDQCLPPMLCAPRPDPMPECSKALRGLSVLSRVARIFTGTTISPGVLSRQRPNRYVFRAGQNLPDKEFRYLRTVIVTAAVYWGLGSRLRSP